MAKNVRKTLTLNQKVELIQLYEASGGSMGSRKLAERYGVGRTQIQSILKRKAEVLEDFESNAPGERKRKIRKTGNEEINALTWEWFKDAVARKIPVSGPLLQERALSFAKDLSVDDFKASNGWLDSFRRRHNIGFSVMSGESGDVDNGIVADWKKKLPSLLEGYEPRDVYNMDETGLFFRSTANKTLFVKGEECRGGKKSKERLTVALCANMVGDKEQPLVIGKSQKPRCFKNIDPKTLPVDYHANRKAWMNSQIFEDWVRKFDRKMRRQRRNVLLFIDNAPSHPTIKLNNVKLVFLPANTTSKSQPMDQGIIQATKLKYRKHQLRHIIRRMDEDKVKSGSDFLKEINVLDTIMWISQSWRDVDPVTVQKCFRTCGFTSQGDIDDVVVETEDESMDEVHLGQLAEELFGCSLQDIIDIEQEVATCRTEEWDWEQPAGDILEQIEEDEAAEESDDENIQPSEEKAAAIQNFSQAMQSVADLKDFVLRQGLADMLGAVTDIEDALGKKYTEKVSSAKQTSVLDFFKPVRV
ncbi:tigger transposable element-derived protein 4-like [Ptychodera flava]|uniref:tigger transposable element-derived protein 4-like n=1 Tax=Ptychodera flava TaxID=63121 RepID=UPI003969CD7F